MLSWTFFYAFFFFCNIFSKKVFNSCDNKSKKKIKKNCLWFGRESIIHPKIMPTQGFFKWEFPRISPVCERPAVGVFKLCTSNSKNKKNGASQVYEKPIGFIMFMCVCVCRVFERKKCVKKRMQPKQFS